MNMTLYKRRLATAALQTIQSQLGLGRLSRRIDSDNPDEVSLLNDGHTVRFYSDNDTRFAVVEFIDDVTAWFECPDPNDLIEQARFREFHPEELGIDVNNPIVATVDLTDIIAEKGELMHTLPKRPRSPRPPYRRTRVFASLS